MKKTSRWLAFALVLTMLFALVACGGNGDPDSSAVLGGLTSGESDVPGVGPENSDDPVSSDESDVSGDSTGTTTKTPGGKVTVGSQTSVTKIQGASKLKIMCRTFPLYVNGIKGMAFNTDYQKKTGVTVEWQEVPETQMAEKITATMASGVSAYPDIIINGISASQVRNYSKQGLLAELSESTLKTNSPNIWKCINSSKDVKAAVTQKDGKIYSVPHVTGNGTVDENGSIFGSRLYINKKWLDKLGLKVLTTYAAFKNVMKQFVTKDPNGNGINDEVGLVMETINGVMVGGPQGIEWEQDYDYMYVDSSKKVHYFLGSEAYRKSLKFLNDLYKDGSLDMKTFTCTRTVAKACADNTEVGAFVNLACSITMPESKMNDYVPIAPLKGDASVKQAVAPTSRGSGINGCGAVMTVAATKNGRLETALKWLDYFYTQEGYFYKEYGPSGYYYNDNADGTKTGATDKNGKALYNDNDRYKFAPGWIFPGWAQSFNSLWKDAANKKETVTEKYYKQYDQKEAGKLYKNAAAKDYIAQGSLVFSDTADKKLPQYKSTLHKYAQDCMNMFVTGSISTDTGWADYLAELKRLGQADLEKLYQTAYDESR